MSQEQVFSSPDDDPAFSSVEDVRELFRSLSLDNEEPFEMPDPFEQPEEEEDSDIERVTEQTLKILTLFKVEDINSVGFEMAQKILYECEGELQAVVDLCLVVSDEIRESLGKHWPITAEYLLERAATLTPQEMFDQTSKDVDQLSGVFGWKRRNKLYAWTNSRPRHGRATRRLSWVLRQPFMEDFEEEVKKELIRRQELGEPERFGLSDTIGLANALVELKLSNQRQNNALNESTSYNREADIRDLSDLERALFVCRVI